MSGLQNKRLYYIVVQPPHLDLQSTFKTHQTMLVEFCKELDGFITAGPEIVKEHIEQQVQEQIFNYYKYEGREAPRVLSGEITDNKYDLRFVERRNNFDYCLSYYYMPGASMVELYFYHVRNIIEVEQPVEYWKPENDYLTARMYKKRVI